MEEANRKAFRPFYLIGRIERSVLLELLQAFVIAGAGLTLIAIVGSAYEAVRDGFPLDTLLGISALAILPVLPWTIPTAFTAACIRVYGRMADHNELTAVRASGIHLWRVLSPATFLALGLCVLCAVIRHDLGPSTMHRQYLMMKAGSASEQAAAIRMSDPVMEIGRYLIYIGELNKDDSFRDIVIVIPENVIASGESDAEGRTWTSLTYVRSPRGRYEYSDDESVITFHLESDPDQKTSNNPDAGRCQMIRAVHRPGRERDWHRAYFDSASVPIRLPSVEDLRLLPRKEKFLSTAELILQLRKREAEIGNDDTLTQTPAGLTPGEATVRKKQLLQRRDEAREWRTTIHRRSALSLAPLLLAAIAVPIAVIIGRGQRAVAFGLAIAIVVGYYALMAIGWRLGRFGLVSPGTGIWGATVATATCGALLLRRILRQ